MRRLIIAFGVLAALAAAGAPAAAADHDAMSEKQALLDRFYPFVDSAAPPPGRWVDRRWDGPRGWRTRHGAAVVVWRLGAVSEVFGARFPDGSRGDVGSTLDHGLRRPGDDHRLWIYGGVEIGPDDRREFPRVDPL